MTEGRRGNVEGGTRRDDDRFWILVDARGRGAAGAAPRPASSAGPRPTLVARDGDTLLLSVDVGRGSALAVPFRVDQLESPGATLIVRMASPSTPCAACVDEGLAAAARAQGGLDAAGVFDAVRAAIARCDALTRADPDHAAAARAPEGAAPRSSSGGLRLAPPNAPHVPAGNAKPNGDVDVVLII